MALRNIMSQISMTFPGGGHGPPAHLRWLRHCCPPWPSQAEPTDHTRRWLRASQVYPGFHLMRLCFNCTLSRQESRAIAGRTARCRCILYTVSQKGTRRYRL